MSKHPYVTDKKYECLASILIPSRKRIDSLINCLESVKNKTKNLKDIEVIIRLDKDDSETLQNIDRIHEFNNHFNLRVIVDDRGGGYADIHLMNNQLYLESIGEFLVVLNDDSVIASDAWDVLLKKYSGCIGVIEAKVREYVNGDGNDIHSPRDIPWVTSGGKMGTTHTFIIMHRLIPETLGYYCLHPSADRQWDMFVYNEPSLKILEHDIELHHHILPAEHVKDGIITHPDSVMEYKEQLEKDSFNLVQHLKKNNFRS